jgi:hypothetical protein
MAGNEGGCFAGGAAFAVRVIRYRVESTDLI